MDAKAKWTPLHKFFKKSFNPHTKLWKFSAPTVIVPGDLVWVQIVEDEHVQYDPVLFVGFLEKQVFNRSIVVGEHTSYLAQVFKDEKILVFNLYTLYLKN